MILIFYYLSLWIKSDKQSIYSELSFRLNLFKIEYFTLESFNSNRFLIMTVLNLDLMIEGSILLHELREMT